MARKLLTRLHWKLFFPTVALLWLIIGITISYFVVHEKQRVKTNLEGRLMNVNNTVLEAYNQDMDLQATVNFIRLFTDNTTLDPLRITVYDSEGNMLADNPAATIHLNTGDPETDRRLQSLIDSHGSDIVSDMVYENNMSMISARMSDDGRVVSFAALPYNDEVLEYIRIDPMVWLMVIFLGLASSIVAFFAVRAVCNNVYVLRDFAEAIAEDKLPDDVEPSHFSRDELGDVSRKLLTLYRDKLNVQKEKVHFERQVSMNVSHELKTPVGIIKGYIDSILADPNMPEETRDRFLLRIQQNADRLATLVNDVTMLLRFDENSGRLEHTVFDVHKLAVRVAEDIDHSKLALSQTFSFDIPEGCLVVGHESLLTNAILNLVYNAVKYSEGTEIHFDWMGCEDGFQVFRFADNGVGVGPEHLGRLFEMFYRVDNGRSRKMGGSGLGLPLVQRIIRSMGGDITVNNAPQGGLVFTFRLPAAENKQ